jgi:DNA-binding response OmpR family regulator
MASEQARPMLLYVEDEYFTRLNVQAVLQEAGFEVVIALNGALALASLEARNQGFQGLITDIRLGEGPNGWDVARRARELFPDLPIVYLSGAGAEEWTSKGVPHSIMVSKPFAPTQVVVAVSSLLSSIEAGL